MADWLDGGAMIMAGEIFPYKQYIEYLVLSEYLPKHVYTTPSVFDYTLYSCALYVYGEDNLYPSSHSMMLYFILSKNI
jgi:hypothetical protein